MEATRESSATSPYVFICYSHEDEARVYPVIESLQADGIELWFDRGIRAGTIWRTEIAQALDRATHVVFFVSGGSLASAHCDREVQYALDHDKAILPVFLDDVELTPALRVVLSRVQALYRSKLSEDALRETLRNALLGGAATPETAARRPVRAAARRRRAITLAVTCLVTAAAVGAWWYARALRAPALPTYSIAVLPFTALGDEAEVRHLTDAIVEEITGDLSAQSGLKVAAKASLTGSETQRLGPLAASLGVSYALVGSVRAFGDGYRATAQLVRAGDETQLWSQSFDFGRAAGEMEDTARLIGLFAAGRLGTDVMLAAERRLATNDEAFDDYAQAVLSFREFLTGGVNNDPGWTAHALASVDRAIELDPSFAPAYQMRALILANGNPGQLDRQQLAREARRSVDRYIELAPDDPGGYLLRGLIQLRFELDLAGAEASLLHARRLYANSQAEYEQQANLAMLRGDEDAAISNFKHEFEIDASVGGDHVTYGYMLLGRRDFAEADREFDTAQKLWPRGSERLPATVGQIWAASLQGRQDEAKARFDAAWSAFGHSVPEAFVLVLPAVGREQELRDLMKQWDAGARQASAFTRFNAHYALGEYDEAMKWLMSAIDERDFTARLFVRLPSAYPEIRNHPALPEVLAHLDAVEVSH